MEVECSHAQVRRVHKLDVRTPLIAPSFSSRGFPYVSDIWEEFRHKLFGVCLVSAYDVAAGRIPAEVTEMVNVVIVDSGLYETNKGRIDSGDRHTPSPAPDWTRDQYHEAVKSIDERGNTVLVNFDQVGKLEDQIARALEDFSLATCAASDFLVKPLDPTELINVPKLNQHVEALKQFGVIGITAREAGNSFLKRCSSIVMLRDILNDARLDTPIHVFGAINPYEVLVLATSKSGTVGNQQKWHALKPERSWVGWRSGELPEGPVVASSPFDCLGLHLPSPAQYVFSPAPQHVRGRHVAQGLVVTPVVVVADEGHDGRLQV